MTIPKLFGPPLFPRPVLECFLEVENGFGLFALENDSGFIQLESCRFQPAATFLIALENGTGTLLLQNGTGSIELEVGP